MNDATSSPPSSAIVVLTLVLGIVYPLVITGVSQVAFPGNANGQQIYVDGKLVGSKLIGQSFAQPVLDKNGKPSDVKTACRSPNRTRATSRRARRRPKAAPTTPPPARSRTTARTARHDRGSDRRKHQGLPRTRTGPYYPGGLTAAKIPVDAANSSASGLDPDISQANAGSRPTAIAAVRAPPLATVARPDRQVHARAAASASPASPASNVLELNLALDRLTGGND